jgi:hypothetical protein
LDGIVKETLQKDASLRTVLNGIFKSEVSPLQMTYDECNEADLVEAVSNYEQFQKSKSEPKYIRKIAERTSKASADVPNFKIGEDFIHSNHLAMSAEKVHKKTLLQENQQVINDYESQKYIVDCKDLIVLNEELPIQSSPKVEQKPVNQSKSYKIDELQTPERQEKKKLRSSETRYNDEVSNFALSCNDFNNISSPNTEKQYQKQKSEFEQEEFKNIVDVEILLKEYELGKELLAKASDKIDEDSFKNLYKSTSKYNAMSDDDYGIIEVFMSLLLSI